MSERQYPKMPVRYGQSQSGDMREHPCGDWVRASAYDELLALYRHQCQEEAKALKIASDSMVLSVQIIDKLKAELAAKESL